ncbi:hypothetical protein [Gracilimonas mengyeensis]|uniref:Uncharacterized protein n=1 Tax=Gracilimonas mengyeensis TaxID=1302730 RepID=A0A521C156_9BACT|nr:hypothetical protein [Gracilimonas mengyeensis]SMO53133.1 hypothetical protein SAMN06265219_10470 [Gracilimonas mengyeensis]
MKFSNAQAPIGVTSYRLDKGDKLLYRSSDSTEYYLFTNNFWEYESLGNYAPDDGLYIIEKKDYLNDSKYKDGIILTRGVGINNIFDLRLYTDGLATLGDESNGLIQTTASFKHIIHRINYPNKGLIVPFHYTKTNLNLRKFDSKFASIDTSNFTRSSYLQKSWLSTDISFSLINGWVENKSLSSFYLDFGAGLFLSDLKEQDNSKTTISYAFFLEPGLNLELADNFGTDLSIRRFLHYSPETSFNNEDKRRRFLNTQFELFWNPLGDRNSRIYGALSHTIDMKTKDSFFELQFGYSIRLTDLFKK